MFVVMLGRDRLLYAKIFTSESIEVAVQGISNETMLVSAIPEKSSRVAKIE
jgi:hypothetical protein